MGAKSPSGFYVGRKAGVLLALLLAALLLALLVLALLYGRSLRELADERLRKGPSAAPPSAGPSPASTRAPGPWDRLRLPASLAPVHYSLRLWPHLAPGLPQPRTFCGWVNITVRCRQETATVLLHSHRLAFRSAAVWGPLGGPGGSANASLVALAELWLAERHQFAVLELRERLRAGALYELRFAFDGQLVEGASQGLFCSAYEDEGERRWLVASQLQPTHGRSVYPCFDEPAMKATFNVSIIHHPSYVALSNMPAIDVSEYKDVNESQLSTLSNWTTSSNWSVTTFKTTLKMSTYITAFVVCNFDYVTTTVRGNEIRIWAEKDAIRDGCADYALNITGPIFSFMEDFLNISYSLSKADLIALPFMSSLKAMENWGLITFEKKSLLYCPQDKFTGRKILISQMVCHEIAHQWFGNLVTMDWWNDLWLNEGFATYFEYLCADYIEPSVPLNKVFTSDVLLFTMKMDKGILSRSISNRKPTEEIGFTHDLFGFHTYEKGASIIQMLSSFISEKLFIKALQSYLNTFSFASAKQDDLWDHIQKVIDEQADVQLPAPIKVIMDSWTCQQGFPLLTVNLATGNISQEQLYFVKDKNITNNTWIIPISWIRNGTIQPLVWLDKKSKIFPEMKISDSEHDWIILNANVTGYYRVNYDQSYWIRLAKILASDPKAIPGANRLQLLDDAFELERSGYMEYGTILYLTKYLEKEDEILIWREIQRELGGNVIHFQSDYELYPVLKKFFLTQISPIYHHYAKLLRESFEVLEGDFYTNDAIKYLFKATCWLGFRDCLDLASEILTKWMDNPKHEIPLAIRSTICCYGVQRGSDEEWDFIWKIYNSSDSKTEEEEYNLFSALTCTRESWILQRYLQYTLNDSIISPDKVPEVLGSVAETEVGHLVAWNFLTENWLVLYERYGIEPLHNLLESSQHFITTDLQIQMVQFFLNNTLTEEERIAVNDILLRAKNKNKEKKNKVTKAIKWLQNNING